MFYYYYHQNKRVNHHYDLIVNHIVAIIIVEMGFVVLYFWLIVYEKFSLTRLIPHKWDLEILFLFFIVLHLWDVADFDVGVGF